MRVIPKSSLAVVNGIEVNGVWRPAGVVRDFKSAPEFAQVLKDRVSLSWVTLKDLAPLEPHVHPIESFVAIVRGQARLIGQENLVVESGQVVRIPAGHWHGFEAVDELGFEGLSWQSASNHLFGDGPERLVYFRDESESTRFASAASAAVESGVDHSVPCGDLTFRFVNLGEGDTWSFAKNGISIIVIVSGSVNFQSSFEKSNLQAGDAMVVTIESQIRSSDGFAQVVELQL